MTRPKRSIRAYSCGLYTTLAVVAGVGFAVALSDLTMGGFYFRVLVVRLSSWEVYKPFRIGMVAIVAAIAIRDRWAEPAQTSWNAIDRWSRWIAGAVAMSRSRSRSTGRRRRRRCVRLRQSGRALGGGTSVGTRSAGHGRVDRRAGSGASRVRDGHGRGFDGAGLSPGPPSPDGDCDQSRWAIKRVPGRSAVRRPRGMAHLPPGRADRRRARRSRRRRARGIRSSCFSRATMSDVRQRPVASGMVPLPERAARSGAGLGIRRAATRSNSCRPRIARPIVGAPPAPRDAPAAGPAPAARRR